MFDLVFGTASALYVHHPLRLLAVAGAFVAVYLILRGRGGPRAESAWLLLAPAGAWFVGAVTEAIALVWAPNVKFRVDLAVYWPILLLVTAWGVSSVLWPKPRGE